MNKMDIIETTIIQGMTKKKVKAYQVNDWFTITRHGDDGFRVYALHSGRCILDASFLNVDSAVTFAEYYTETYKDYFDLWQEYPDADLARWLQWTIKHGIRHHEFFKKLEEEKRIVSLGMLPVG